MSEVCVHELLVVSELGNTVLDVFDVVSLLPFYFDIFGAKTS